MSAPLPLTNPPFTRDPKRPPLHLREWSTEELEQHRRLIRKQEQQARAWRKLHEETRHE